MLCDVLQVVMFLQILPVYFFLPSAAYAYDAFRAEEQVFKQVAAACGWQRQQGPAVHMHPLVLDSGC